MKIQFWFPAALGVIFPHASSSLALTTTTTSPSCPLTFDGRIPQNFTKATFETAQSPFNRKYVLGLSKYLRLYSKFFSNLCTYYVCTYMVSWVG